MVIGNLIELGDLTVRILDKCKWTDMNLFELGNFNNCTIEVFEEGIVAIHDKDKCGGSCGLYVLDAKSNEMYEAKLDTINIDHYNKKTLN